MYIKRLFNQYTYKLFRGRLYFTECSHSRSDRIYFILCRYLIFPLHQIIMFQLHFGISLCSSLAYLLQQHNNMNNFDNCRASDKERLVHGRDQKGSMKLQALMEKKNNSIVVLAITRCCDAFHPWGQLPHKRCKAQLAARQLISRQELGETTATHCCNHLLLNQSGLIEKDELLMRITEKLHGLWSRIHTFPLTGRQLHYKM